MSDPTAKRAKLEEILVRLLLLLLPVLTLFLHPQGPGPRNNCALGKIDPLGGKDCELCVARNGLPSWPGEELYILLHVELSDRLRSKPRDRCVVALVYKASQVGRPDAYANDYFVPGLTAEVVDEVGPERILALVQRNYRDAEDAVRLLVARTPPPAPCAFRLQLQLRLSELALTCPVVSVAEFCARHHCASAGMLYHGSCTPGFVQLHLGAFTTTNDRFAARYMGKREVPEAFMLEFRAKDNFRVVDVQGALDRLFAMFGGTNAAEMIGNAKRARALDRLADDLREKFPGTMLFLGLFMQSEPELVCLDTITAEAVCVYTDGVHLRERRIVTDDEVERLRVERAAAFRAEHRR